MRPAAALELRIKKSSSPCLPAPLFLPHHGITVYPSPDIFSRPFSHFLTTLAKFFYALQMDKIQEIYVNSSIHVDKSFYAE